MNVHTHAVCVQKVLMVTQKKCFGSDIKEGRADKMGKIVSFTRMNRLQIQHINHWPSETSSLWCSLSIIFDNKYFSNHLLSKRSVISTDLAVGDLVQFVSCIIPASF